VCTKHELGSFRSDIGRYNVALKECFYNIMLFSLSVSDLESVAFSTFSFQYVTMVFPAAKFPFFHRP